MPMTPKKPNQMKVLLGRSQTAITRLPMCMHLVLLALLFAGCQYDPHAHLYTTNEPKEQDAVGTSVLDDLHLPQECGTAHPDIAVELRADGTFIAINIPSS